MIFMRKNIKYILYIFLSVLLFFISFLLFQKSINNYTQDKVSYNEVSNIDYKVYLKENSYFDSPYLGENKVYITSLIDYIDIDFSYDLKLDDKRSGKYSYYLKGIMSANVSNSDKDYWQKTYDLLKIKEVEYDNTDSLSFSENIKIDYQTYNDLLLQFKEDYKVAMDGNFKVILVVDNYVESTSLEQLKKVTTTNLEIPLTRATIEVPIVVNEVNDRSELLGNSVYDDEVNVYVFKALSSVSFLAGLYILGYAIFKIVRSLEKISLYNKELRKILKTYDGIIVNVNKLPNNDGTNMIEVNSFNELLDAHGEIRQPISYYETHKKAIFQLINGNVVWRYVLRDKDYEK